MTKVLSPDDYLPDFQTFINLEKETLKCIAMSSILQKFAPALASKASHSFRKIDPKLGFIWDLNFDAKYTRGKKTSTFTIYLGAKIQVSKSGTYECVTYSVTICDEKGAAKKIIKKLHFDCEPSSAHSEPKPCMHVQHCGKLSPFLKSYGYQDKDIEHLTPDLEKPRFPTQPVSLGILLDWVFHEFWEEEDLQRLTKESTWRAHIKNIEEKLLHPYFVKCSEATKPSRQTSKSLFMSQFVYRQN